MMVETKDLNKELSLDIKKEDFAAFQLSNSVSRPEPTPVPLFQSNTAALYDINVVSHICLAHFA